MSKQSDLISVSQGASGDPLYIDTTNDRVGVRTSSPSAQLDVVGAVRLTNTANPANFGTISDGGGLVVNSGNNNPMYFYTGGAERMRIDSSGRVTTPYQPAFYYSSSLTTYTSGLNISYLNSSTITSGSILVNNGNHWNFSTGLFTAPVAGNYMFFMQASNDGATSGTVVFMEKNNSLYGYYAYIYTNVGYNTGGFNYVVSLSANDTVRFGYLDFTASGERLYTSSFGGYLIG